MPCGDVTELIDLTLDQEHRISAYRLSKKTCGGAVGLESFLLGEIGGLSANQIAEAEDRACRSPGASRKNIEEFLKWKHFNAVRSVIRAYFGMSGCGVGDACTISTIDYDDNQTMISAEINVDLMVEEIESCSHCGPG
jgi:hypothetical protein